MGALSRSPFLSGASILHLLGVLAAPFSREWPSSKGLGVLTPPPFALRLTALNQLIQGHKRLALLSQGGTILWYNVDSRAPCAPAPAIEQGWPRLVSPASSVTIPHGFVHDVDTSSVSRRCLAPICLQVSCTVSHSTPLFAHPAHPQESPSL